MSLIRKIFCLFLLFLLVSGNTLNAQFYSTGQDPASNKWMQINTNNFQIIFQNDFHQQAQQIANILEFYYQKEGISLNHNPKKVSVIVHNQTIRSNGYVVWAPKRMELFTTPSPDHYPDPWLEHLCIHELRHVVQIDKLNQGITKILSVIFGQQAIGLVSGQMPIWYYEGDAVCTETAFSEFGRGRLPYFHRGIKTHLLSDEERYSFDKMLFGSFQDYVPGYYELGYNLTAYARKKYGVNVWEKTENHVAQNSYTLAPTPFAFYRGLKKNTGLSQKQLFIETFNYLDSSWSAEDIDNKTIEPGFFQKYNIDEYEDYINPLIVDKESGIALKKGKSHIPQFVLINEDSEEVLLEPGILISNDFSFANNILTWAEYKPDLRWNNREFTSIKLFNIRTKLSYTLVKKGRFFSPDISKSAEKIAVIEVDEKNIISLNILSVLTGEITKKIHSPKGNLIQRPKWSHDEKSIYVIESTQGIKQISKYDLDKEEWETVFTVEGVDIQRILPYKDQVYFHSTINGTDNIYVFNENSKDIYQLSASRFGISEFDLDTNKSELFINEYTSRGFRLAKIPVERALWKKINKAGNYKFEFAEILSEQETFKTTQTVREQKEFPIKSYNKAINLFNFHSWLPLYFDYDNIDVGNVFADPSEIYRNIHPGIMLLSQNKLSTTESVLSYAYKNGNHYLSSSLVFKGQYPVVKLTANYGDYQQIQATGDATWSPEANIGYSYDLDVYVPLDFSEGKFIKGIRPLLSVQYVDNLYYNYHNDYYINGLEFIQTGLLLYSYQLKAERDIIPKQGAIFKFNLFNTPFDKEIFGYLYNVDAIFYFPGIKNGGLRINTGYQYQNPRLYLFNSNFDFPRGIQDKRTEKLTKLYTDYVFPIAYPDWSLGSVLYLKRIRGDVFLDYAYNSYRVVNQSQTAYIWPKEHNYSFGFELTADYHLLRMTFPLNSGLRLGYTPTEGKYFVEFLFGIDLYSF
ncbi:MAG: hypothetical protein KOO66_07520 [Bacteroidales bacterium]|nr:hypothetical protein [Bacteroidales bacterium]